MCKYVHEFGGGGGKGEFHMDSHEFVFIILFVPLFYYGSYFYIVYFSRVFEKSEVYDNMDYEFYHYSNLQ